LPPNVTLLTMKVISWRGSTNSISQDLKLKKYSRWRKEIGSQA
jgi:hypothetical protein